MIGWKSVELMDTSAPGWGGATVDVGPVFVSPYVAEGGEEGPGKDHAYSKILYGPHRKILAQNWCGEEGHCLAGIYWYQNDVTPIVGRGAMNIEILSCGPLFPSITTLPCGEEADIKRSEWVETGRFIGRSRAGFVWGHETHPDMIIDPYAPTPDGFTPKYAYKITQDGEILFTVLPPDIATAAHKERTVAAMEERLRKEYWSGGGFEAQHEKDRAKLTAWRSA